MEKKGFEPSLGTLQGYCLTYRATSPYDFCEREQLVTLFGRYAATLVRRDGVEPPESKTLGLQPSPLPLRFNDACYIQLCSGGCRIRTVSQGYEPCMKPLH